MKPLVLVVILLTLELASASAVAFPPDNQTLFNQIPSPESGNPSIGNLSVNTTVRRNEWWPPSDMEVVQTSPYTPEIHQSILPAYYLQEPTAPPLTYRSEPWPYRYPEFGNPLLAQDPNHQLGVTPKFMTVALFIGLLTLFAIIQGSMISAKQKEITDVFTRRKRDLSFQIDALTLEQEEILNDFKVRCIQRTICQENRELLNDFGARGIRFAKYLTRNVKKTLKRVSGWDRLVQDAAAAGLRGDDCDVLYRDCAPDI